MDVRWADDRLKLVRNAVAVLVLVCAPAYWAWGMDDRTTALEDDRSKLTAIVSRHDAHLTSKAGTELGRWRSVTDLCATGQLDSESEWCKIAPSRLTQAKEDVQSLNPAH